MELWEMKHDTLGKAICRLEKGEEEHESRLRVLEKQNAKTEEQIKNLLDSMATVNMSLRDLIGWIKWGLAFIIPSFLAFFAWLLQQQLV